MKETDLSTTTLLGRKAATTGAWPRPGRRRHRRDRLDTLALSRHQQAPAIVVQWLRPIRMPDHPDHRLDIGREPLLPVLAHGAVSPQTPTLEGTSATHAKSCDFLTQ